MTRRSADVPLASLTILALSLVAGLLAYAVYHVQGGDALVECRTLLATVVAGLSRAVVLMPLGVAMVIAIGTVLATWHQLWETRRLIRRVTARLAVPDGRVRALAARAGVERLDLVEDAAAYAFCHGFRRPRVCVSRGMVELLDEHELTAALAHEAHHCRHHEPTRILVSRALASGLAFLPLAGALHAWYLAGKELCADDHAVARAGARALAGALVKVLAADRPPWPAGVLAIGAFSATDARLGRLVDPQRVQAVRPSTRDWIVSAMVVAAIFGFGYGASAAVNVPPIDAACSPQSAWLADPAWVTRPSAPHPVAAAPCLPRTAIAPGGAEGEVNW